MPLRMANPVWIAVALVVHLPHRLPSHHPSNLLEHSGSGDGGALTAEWTGMDRNGPEWTGRGWKMQVDWWAGRGRVSASQLHSGVNSIMLQPPLIHRIHYDPFDRIHFCRVQDAPGGRSLKS